MSAADLLAIGAHPDDIEIGCGGTLHKAAKSGWRVVGADLTKAELSTIGNPELRRQEAEAAAQVLGLTERINLELPDTGVGDHPDHLKTVVRLIRQNKPRIVLAPWLEDRHPDHAAAGKLVEQAVFLSGVQKFDELPPHRPQALYHYMVHHPFTPSFVVDISSSWEAKQRALAAYVSQFAATDADPKTGIAHPSFLSALQARDVWTGALVGAAYGEGFFSRGPLAVGGLDVFGVEGHAYRAY